MRASSSESNPACKPHGTPSALYCIRCHHGEAQIPRRDTAAHLSGTWSRGNGSMQDGGTAPWSRTSEAATFYVGIEGLLRNEATLFRGARGDALLFLNPKCTNANMRETCGRTSEQDATVSRSWSFCSLCATVQHTSLRCRIPWGSVTVLNLSAALERVSLGGNRDQLLMQHVYAQNPITQA